VVAVDPSSPYSGGAILGDRIRMQEHALDEGVFIRSMATRGAMGGMAHACLDVVDILDVAGFDTVLIETVGVGQDEVEIANASPPPSSSRRRGSATRCRRSRRASSRSPTSMSSPNATGRIPTGR
jgi:hypothetical protein